MSMEFLTEYSGFGLYMIILVMMLATGLGLPLSEDFLLMVIGYMIFEQKMELVLGVMTAFAGALGSDLLIFNIGYHYGAAVRKHRFILRVFSHRRQERVLKYFRKYGAKFIVVARFLPGLRAPTFLAAGVSHVHPLRFITLDGLAALISIPLLLGLGYFFGSQWAQIEKDFHQIRRIVTVIAIGGFGIFVLMKYGKLFVDRPEKEDL